VTKFERILDTYIVAAYALIGCVFGFCWGCHWIFSILGGLLGCSLGLLMIIEKRIGALEEKIEDLLDRAEAERRLADPAETSIPDADTSRSLDIDETDPTFEN
jgi:hypothetical protein